MRITFRAKLIFIVGATALAFLVLIVTSSIVASMVDQQLAAIQERYIPKVDLEPQLLGQFESLRRALQDAVAARDGDALDATRPLKDGILDRLSAAHEVVDPADATLLRSALEEYYAQAVDLARRMITGETGEALVDAMASMQAKQTRTTDLLKKATAFDRDELAAVFGAAARAQTTARRLRLAVGVTCLIVVTLLSLWVSRGVLAGLADLSAGFARFGKGDFADPIQVKIRDELGDVAEHANHMAASLKRLGAERDRTDWLKAGHAGLTQELRGALEPSEVAARALRFLARHIEAPAAALYYADDKGDFRLLGQYAFSRTESEDGAPASFRAGAGLVGQAALQEDVVVVTEPPPEYFRVRSALGEAAPRVIALLPLVHLGKVTGVVELALFKTWSDLVGELLLSVRETLAIAIEVARARAAMRDLLAETQRQAARLHAQEEELQANNEELQAQQEELRQTNDELTLQTEELEQQRRALQKKNLDLDDARRGLERKAEELTKVSAYKSQFLANMSHELRTPLNSMLLLSNLLAENSTGNLTSKQVEFCKTIYLAGKDLLALINQVLDLAKVESGKQQVTLAGVLLRDLRDYAERNFKPLASDKGLAFRAELAPDLPDAITTDNQRVQQILTNLLANAIKFTERGEVTLRIGRPKAGVRFRHSSLQPEHTVAFAVSDTGVGIAPEHRERIFVPFEQVDAASDRRYGGTGLGLSIARELSDLLGGELELESELGKGSTFVCYLPYQRAERAGEVTRSSPSALAAKPAGRDAAADPAASTTVAAGVESDGSAQSGDPYLLIIEDDAVFAETFGDIIRAQGLHYVWAPNGRSGLTRAKGAHKPGGILLDVRLPDIDGWAVMEELRADPTTADIPVHFISAADAGERGMAMGAVGYLTKPATRRDLVRVVESLAPKIDERSCRILVVEDDGPTADSVVEQLTAEGMRPRRVSSAAEALAAVAEERFVGMILDLSLPDMDGLELLQSLQERCGSEMPAVVVYTARAFTKVEAQRMKAYTEAVVLKEGPSTQRVVDEVRLFVRRMREGLGPRRSRPPEAGSIQVQLEDRKVLVADDDMRTLYALSAMLRAKGAQVFVADSGRSALAALAEHPDVEAVLIDIMMPEMDGYAAIRRIREETRFAHLPIIALTAKAMKDDRQKCLEAGASDYLPKPIDPDRLLTMLDSQLHRSQNGA